MALDDLELSLLACPQRWTPGPGASAKLDRRGGAGMVMVIVTHAGSR